MELLLPRDYTPTRQAALRRVQHQVSGRTKAMSIELCTDRLIQCGLKASETERFVAEVRKISDCLEPREVWRWVTRHLLRPEHPFGVHQYLHTVVFADWDDANGPPPGWIPEDEDVDASNIAWLMREAGKKTYEDLYEWSIREREGFWGTMIDRLGVPFKKPYSSVLDATGGGEHPRWLVGAQLNVVDSCFRAPDDSVAVVYQAVDSEIRTMSIAELRSLVARVANGLVDLGLVPGDRVAIDMPMTVESVGIFLGVIATGCVVVTIADSFVAHEIAVRLRIGETKCIFTQDYAPRMGKKLPIYEKVTTADAPKAIVVPCEAALSCTLREGDIAWEEFLSDNTELKTVACTPDTYSTILFSSGTTGEPKAIPWDQTTPLKSGIDGHLHHDIHPNDVICWPTNLGWMMGPWLVYAALMNRAAMALYYDAPTTHEFGRFVERAGVTMLGLVPGLVSSWKTGDCMAGLDWSSIRAFSSTGECSNPTDMLFLMSLAGYKPIIEYCGGTEIGGGYITGTVVQAAAPGTFSTPALGSELVILNEQNRPADRGEVFLVPPSMGLSLELLNRDHHEVYYAGTPLGPEGQTLRRHGDQMERFANGFFRAHGRVDDSMNLSGIKVSSLQIEEVVSGVGGVRETAAISILPPDGGPGRLIVYAVSAGERQIDVGALKAEMQQAIRTRLNPLFNVHDVVVVDALPRTASNKVMRRTLRADYEKLMAQQ